MVPIDQLALSLRAYGEIAGGSYGRTVNLLSAVHQLAWTQHPAIWLCESCAILWLMLRAVRSPWVRAGVLLVLCGLMLNGMVTAVNAGTMPVVGMPSRVHPVSTMWRAATSETQLPFLADQARLGMFSVGDLVMLFGGILIIVAICLHRALRMEGRLICKRLGWILQEPTGHVTFQCPTPAGRRTAVKHGVTRRVCKIGEDDGIQKIASNILCYLMLKWRIDRKLSLSTPPQLGRRDELAVLCHRGTHRAKRRLPQSNLRTKRSSPAPVRRSIILLEENSLLLTSSPFLPPIEPTVLS
jgi:hypothetical protein